MAINMQIIYIRKVGTGEIRKFADNTPWDGDYIWSDGNYACDCNRSLFFARAAGDEPEFDDRAECGSDTYLVKIEDENGSVLYEDDDWA